MLVPEAGCKIPIIILNGLYNSELDITDEPTWQLDPFPYFASHGVIFVRNDGGSA